MTTPEVIDYSYADNVPLPGQIGVRNGSSVGQLVENIKGINYYVDVIGFGEATGLNDKSMFPLGLRKFVATGLACHNGAQLWEYVDGTAKGDILGERVKSAMKSSGLPVPAGLGPGMLEDARDALNPLPLFNALLGSGYPRCALVEREVGDLGGSIRPPGQEKEVWINPTEVYFRNGRPYQTQWIQDTDRRGNKVWMTENDYRSAAKTHKWDGSPIKEKFTNYAGGVSTKQKDVIAILLLGGLFMSLILTLGSRS